MASYGCSFNPQLMMSTAGKVGETSGVQSKPTRPSITKVTFSVYTKNNDAGDYLNLF